MQHAEVYVTRYLQNPDGTMITRCPVQYRNPSTIHLSVTEYMSPTEWNCFQINVQMTYAFLLSLIIFFYNYEYVVSFT